MRIHTMYIYIHGTVPVIIKFPFRTRFTIVCDCQTVCERSANDHFRKRSYYVTSVKSKCERSEDERRAVCEKDDLWIGPLVRDDVEADPQSS